MLTQDHLTAYNTGKTLAVAGKYASMAAAAEAEDFPMWWSWREWSLCEMGFLGHSLQVVTGTRYGDLPAGGRSYDHRSNRAEDGVSFYQDGLEDYDLISAIFVQADRPQYRVRFVTDNQCPFYLA